MATATPTEYILTIAQKRLLLDDGYHGGGVNEPWFAEGDDVRLYRHVDGRCELYVNGQDTGILSNPGAYDDVITD